MTHELRLLPMVTAAFIVYIGAKKQKFTHFLRLGANKFADVRKNMYFCNHILCVLEK